MRGTGSHDYAVADMFVPAAHSLSFREPPSAPGPLYALPTIALFGTVLAAVPLGIARHAIDILTELGGTKIATRSQQALREDATMRGIWDTPKRCSVPVAPSSTKRSMRHGTW